MTHLRLLCSRRGVDFYKDHSEKGAERQVTEEERRRVEKRQQTAQKVAKVIDDVIVVVNQGLMTASLGNEYSRQRNRNGIGIRWKG